MCKSVFSCPVCGNNLDFDDKTYRCIKNHCFDKAKSGYVNLLTSDKMHSKLPGDNKLMVKARREFLSKGYYSCLSESLCGIVEKYTVGNDVVFLDAGCGEGYYTENVVSKLHGKIKNINAGGFDISKNAVDYAAKSGKNSIEYVAASVFHIPVKDSTADVVMSVFSPLCLDEFKRVLKNDGLFFMVIPDKKHLWDLKCVLYENPYENKVKDYALEGFEFLEAFDVPSTKIRLQSNDDVMSLFAMTPYFYNTRPEDKKKLECLEEFETTVEFKILVYRNKGE